MRNPAMLAHGAIDPPAAGRLQFTVTLKRLCLPASRARVHLFISFLPSSAAYPSPPSCPTADLFCSTSPLPQSISSLPAASHPPDSAALRYARPSPCPPAVSPGRQASLPAKMPALRALFPAQRRTVARSNQTRESSTDLRIPRSLPPFSSPAPAPPS